MAELVEKEAKEVIVKNNDSTGIEGLKLHHFVDRDSQLTNMFRESFRVKILYASWWFLVLAFNALILHTNHPEIHEIYFWGFEGLVSVAVVWIFMAFFSIFVPYLGVKLWKSTRRTNSESQLTLFDKNWICLYVVIQVIFLLVTNSVKTFFEWNVGSKAIIMVEQIRFAMKIHSFVRENISKGKSTDYGQELETLSTLKSYIYFLFAPTLIYRSSYQLRSQISWRFVLLNALQVAACIMTASSILIYFNEITQPYFAVDGLHLKGLLHIFAASLIPGIAIMWCAFFGLLHSWMNLFAELTRFSDRQFYTEWWKCRSMGQFLRTWNTLVYNWLYVYVYSDIFKASRSRGLAMTMVFLLSSTFHEYVLCHFFNFFYPVLFVMFMGGSFSLMHVKNQTRHYGWFLVALVCLGYSIMMTLYSVELQSRKRCAIANSSDFTQYYVPHTFNCVFKPKLNA